MSRPDAPRPAGGDGTGSGDAPGEGPRRTLLSVAWKAVAGLAALGALVLGVGVALPGTWAAERSVVIDAPADSVFGWIASPARWDEWTAWAGIESTFSGPESGEGATRRWDDPWAGDGVFRVGATIPGRHLEYSVAVQGGSMTTEGVFDLEAAPGGATRVRWREAGDFGWNPLMGYAALNMDRIQGTELERGLARLKALAEEGALPDSLRLVPDGVAGDGPDGAAGDGPDDAAGSQGRPGTGDAAR